MFSKACEYGIKAVIHISLQSQTGKRVSLKEISGAIDSPLAFTAKILQSLAKSNIIESSKGSVGGYHIPEDVQSKLTLYEIVIAIDGDNIFERCGLGLRQCNETSPCPIHSKFKIIRENLIDMMKKTNLLELAISVDKGESVLVI
ncbi:Rrf2 family transcriptional regulator [Aureitalea sp. L0-47]|uniref:RrF2 family transcriptional regulator n=1 Tax=Aureitalea sp. L0-47 TaxID=2816962 RepID=UPI002238191F|nr:Rrf2 family transcriptional regulator [Aureitalea sp. L0-47]MCW5518805.1 Rrf2 family transcriptional regulator [Aureitalea sp. L0-47]